MDVASIIPPLLDPVGGRDTRSADVLNPTTTTSTNGAHLITPKNDSREAQDTIDNNSMNPTTTALFEQEHVRPATGAAHDSASRLSGVINAGYELSNLTSTSTAPASIVAVTSPPISASATSTPGDEQPSTSGNAHPNYANITASSSMPRTPGTPGYELPGAYPGGEDDGPSTAVSYINAGAQSAAAYLSQSVRAYLPDTLSGNTNSNSHEKNEQETTQASAYDRSHPSQETDGAAERVGAFSGVLGEEGGAEVPATVRSENAADVNNDFAGTGPPGPPATSTSNSTFTPTTATSAARSPLTDTPPSLPPLPSLPSVPSMSPLVRTEDPTGARPFEHTDVRMGDEQGVAVLPVERIIDRSGEAADEEKEKERVNREKDKERADEEKKAREKERADREKRAREMRVGLLGLGAASGAAPESNSTNAITGTNTRASANADRVADGTGIGMGESGVGIGTGTGAGWGTGTGMEMETMTGGHRVGALGLGALNTEGEAVYPSANTNANLNANTGANTDVNTGASMDVNTNAKHVSFSQDDVKPNVGPSVRDAGLELKQAQPAARQSADYQTTNVQPFAQQQLQPPSQQQQQPYDQPPQQSQQQPQQPQQTQTPQKAKKTGFMAKMKGEARTLLGRSSEGKKSEG